MHQIAESQSKSHKSARDYARAHTDTHVHIHTYTRTHVHTHTHTDDAGFAPTLVETFERRTHDLDKSKVTRHTSHVTRHTSHMTRHTSHVTRHTSDVTRHTSHITRHTSHVTRMLSPLCCQCTRMYNQGQCRWSAIPCLQACRPPVNESEHTHN